ncbi:hypothetical protein CYMTET_23379 [Cymbomonas tetramitiformis]|uniref:Uncharacterized protein n=1 Tax=Cymbomonas tetramitiformis TaxID=36881 RepID=A0AAE0L0Z9_9CHLO|nr:hypothetical protein CYMTET_23379 [Cymbomonas tetramitiformis]
MWSAFAPAVILGVTVLWQALQNRANFKEACVALDKLAAELEHVSGENSGYSAVVLSLQAALEEMREDLKQTRSDNHLVYAALAEKGEEVSKLQKHISRLIDLLEDTRGQLESSQSALKNALTEKEQSDEVGRKQRAALLSSLKQCIEEEGFLGTEKLNELYEVAGLNREYFGAQGIHSTMSNRRETYSGEKFPRFSRGHIYPMNPFLTLQAGLPGTTAGKIADQF